MLNKIAFVAAALAALTLSIGAAQANTKGPTPSPTTTRHPGGAASQASNTQYHGYRPGDYRNKTVHQKCYWLPTVSNGSVSGLEQKCIWVKN